FLIGGTVRLAGQNLGQNIIYSNFRNNDAAKIVFDAGVKYKTGLRSFQFGMAIRNFSSNVKRERIYEQMPLLFIMGTTIDVFELVAVQSQKSQLNFAIDFLHPNNYSERINMGLEYSMMKKIALRCGYQTNRDVASWSIGFGINTLISGKNIVFDYSYSNFDIFDGINRLSVGFNF
ncbi:MAG: hypothetical protein JXR87_10290, partial [Candidatus Marinimicrobia bacterium]|nr:hypothetical protein [Candidatus Neomarinimicrobiota bacterium]